MLFGEIVFDDGVTCGAVKTCMSKYNKEFKLRRNQRSFDFDRMFNNGICNVKIKLIENFPCDNAYSLNCKKQK